MDKILVFIAALIPFCYLLFLTLTGGLGADPVETITHLTGEWTLNMLMLTLAVTPLRKLTKWNRLIRYRRMLGLYVFFYGCLHFLTYLVFDQFFDVTAITADVIKRPYITVGFAAFVLLIPLAATSNNKMVQTLGKHWKSLHHLVYLIGVLGVLHFLWLVKLDKTEPLFYIAIFSILMLMRLRFARIAKLVTAGGDAGK
ncbi:MAG: sulfite oxidase heme-binding subunit YedZ [Gammaproteobacteria bacterium]